MIRRTFYEVVVVLFITMVLSIVAYAIRPQALPLWPVNGAQAPFEENAAQLYSMISIDEAIALFKRRTVLFADARPRQTYLEGHIRGALNLDPDQFDSWSESIIERIPPEKFIITYCEGEHCNLSTDLAEKLTWLGFEQVFYLQDGWGQWKQRQLPVAQGEDAQKSPMSQKPVR